MKKRLYLFLALLLPALLFVFLKYEGRNEFSIPVYHGKGVEHVPADCIASYPSPYLVPDSVRGGDQREACIIVFPRAGLEIDKVHSRIKDEFEARDFVFLEPCRQAVDSASCARLKKCVLLINDPYEAVLIDSKGQIRGYYALQTREEEDRLRVEMKILLKRY